MSTRESWDCDRKTEPNIYVSYLMTIRVLADICMFSTRPRSLVNSQQGRGGAAECRLRRRSVGALPSSELGRTGEDGGGGWLASPQGTGKGAGDMDLRPPGSP